MPRENTYSFDPCYQLGKLVEIVIINSYGRHISNAFMASALCEENDNCIFCDRYKVEKRERNPKSKSMIQQIAQDIAVSKLCHTGIPKAEME